MLGENSSVSRDCGYAVTGHMHWYSTVMSTSNQPREKETPPIQMHIQRDKELCMSQFHRVSLSNHLCILDYSSLNYLHLWIILCLQEVIQNHQLFIFSVGNHTQHFAIHSSLLKHKKFITFTGPRILLYCIYRQVCVTTFLNFKERWIGLVSWPHILSFNQVT